MAGSTMVRRFSPEQILVFGFAVMIITGAILLLLPAATVEGKSMGLLNALFTSTSSVCVIGMTLFDISTVLSHFGQITVMVLMQLGGIGFMTMASLVYLVAGKRLTLKDRMLISFNFNESPLQSVVYMTRNVAVITGIMEGLGAALFMTRFIPIYGVGKGIYLSVFHSVSSFCNAGFDIFGGNNSMMPFAGDVLVNVVTMVLVITSGLGFFVVVELEQKLIKRSARRLSLQTKIVLVVSAVLIVSGFLIFLVVEWNNPRTMAEMPAYEKVLCALSQSVNARTSGFYTVHQADLMPLSRVVTIGLMFIGASPASTGGGLKTTTLALVVLFVIAVLKGKDDVEVAGRRMNKSLVLRAVVIFMLAIVFVVVVSAAIFVVEGERLTMVDVTFEVVAAFGTTGFSMGIIPLLSIPSKILMVLTMFAGRVGLFTFTVALAYRGDQKRLNIRYPEDKIMIG